MPQSGLGVVEFGIPYAPLAGLILTVVAEAFGLSRPELQGRGKTHHVVAARSFAFRLMRQRCGLSFAEVGRVFGRDHSTVIYGTQQVEKYRVEYGYEWQQIEERLDQEVIR